MMKNPALVKTQPPILTAEHVSFSYRQVLALRDVSLALYPGQLVALVGLNGAGKTTLLRILSGLYPPLQGAVFSWKKGQRHSLAQLTKAQIASSIAMLEQQAHPAFDFTVFELTEMGRYSHEASPSIHQEAIQSALERTHLTSLAERKFSSLSSGEKQRAFLAMILCQEAQVLLLDEPFNHMDPRYQLELLALLKDLARQGLSLMMTVHDLALAKEADRIIFLNEGILVADGKADQVFSEPLFAEAFRLFRQAPSHQTNLTPTLKRSSP